jgi:DNA-binding NarL/FixJ family response regulator
MPELRRPRVLLADDHDGLHAAITRLLAPFCDVLGGVRDGVALLDATRHLEPDVVVVDLWFPGLNGLEICRALKSTAPYVKVIVFTAEDDDNLRANALAAGAFEYVLKIRAAVDLLPAIERACQGPGRYSDFA